MHLIRLQTSQRKGSLPSALLTPALLGLVPAPKSLCIESSKGFLLCSHHTLFSTWKALERWCLSPATSVLCSATSGKEMTVAL